ncbi:unnamed protein product [Durusdinium trenchii]|uniref:Solute carrier family 40 protein n=1 Tax=Durusdinium trenchii TaxID=1381693 RepID=A0ABP0IC26_9DINO
MMHHLLPSSPKKTEPSEILLPSHLKVSSYQPPPKWQWSDLKSSKVRLCLACCLLQVARNLCRETLLSPSVLARNHALGFQMDSWAWAQLNFLGTFGGIVGFIMSKVMAAQPANPSFIVLLGALSLLMFAMEIHCQSFRALMMANFCGATLRHLSSPLLWKLFEGVISGEEMAALMQAMGSFEIVMGFIVPISCGSFALMGFQTPFCLMVALPLLFLMATMPKSKAE